MDTYNVLIADEAAGAIQQMLNEQMKKGYAFLDVIPGKSGVHTFLIFKEL